VAHDPSHDQVIAGLIRTKAKRLVGQAGFKQQDCLDLENELARCVYARLQAFDSGRGDIESFVHTVAQNCAANILRDRRAGKRASGYMVSLNTIAKGCAGPTELAATISQVEYDAQRGRQPRSAEELAQLALDVTEVIAGLSPALRDFAVRLSTDSLAQVARDLGMARTTVYKHVNALRCIFESKGLRRYL
jgi:DNA-directed RNA polymerase specialized sigma24 family protein